MNTIDKSALLHTHYLFRDIDPTTVERVARLGTTRRLGDAEVLFLKGDPGDALYGLLSGKIRISASAASGKELILNIIEPGGVFGEIALLDGKARSADAVAMGATELFVLQRRDFAGFLENEPRLAIHLLEMVCDRLRHTNDLIEDVTFLNLPARLAKRLLAFARYSVETGEAGSTTEIRISQSDLGLLMGTSRESINRLLQQWRSSGMVTLGRGRVTVNDAAGLQEIVETADKD